LKANKGRKAAGRASKPPAGGTVTVGQLAAELGVSEREVQQLAAEGVIEKAGRGRYVRSTSVARYCAHLRERQAPAGYAEARARKTEAEASLREHELGRQRAETMPVATALAVVRATLQALDGSLRSAPRRHGPALARKLGCTPGVAMAALVDMVDLARADVRAGLVAAAEEGRRG
jgi:hypothetical protein